MRFKFLILLITIVIWSLVPYRIASADFTTGLAAGTLLGMAMAEDEGSSIGGGLILYKDKEAMKSTSPFELRISWHYLSKEQTVWRAFELAVGKRDSENSKLILVLCQLTENGPKLIFFYEMKISEY